MGDRIEDDEILFTTLVLMHGAPPPQPHENKVSDTERVKEHARANAWYGWRIKETLKILGHEPNQGLYTSYMYWCQTHWKEVRDG